MHAQVHAEGCYYIAGGLLSICQGSARRGVGDKEF